MPLVAITGRIKLPTADADSGLGTGEFDEGMGLELTKALAIDGWDILTEATTSSATRRDQLQ